MILSHSRVRAYSFDNMSWQILFLVFLSAKKLYLKITGKPVQPFGFYVLLPSLMRLLYKKRVPTVLLASDTWKTHRPVSCILFCTCSCSHIFAAVAGERFFFSDPALQGSLWSYENKPLFDVLQLRGPGAKAISDNISKLKCVSRLDISDNGE